MRCIQTSTYAHEFFPLDVTDENTVREPCGMLHLGIISVTPIFQSPYTVKALCDIASICEESVWLKQQD